MAAALRSLSRTTYTSRTNTTITAPSGITDGDKLTLVFIAGTTSSSPPSITLPSGFTAKSGYPKSAVDTAATFWVHRWVAEKTAASESGDYTVTHASAASQGLIICASGAEASAVTDAQGNGTTSTAPTITTGTDDALVAFVAHNWTLYGAASPPTGTTPTFTEQLDAADSLIYVATGVLSTQGATGNKSHANLNGTLLTDDGWAALLIGWDAAASGPTISVQPSNATKFTSETAGFSVTASGTGTLSYQWKTSTDGASFSNVSSGSGGTTNSYTTTTLGYADDMDYYKCTVTDDNGSTDSDAALLRVFGAASAGWFRA